MRWVSGARERARTRLANARRRDPLPPFQIDTTLVDATGRVIVAEQASTVDDRIPAGVRIAAAWAWRLILFAGATLSGAVAVLVALVTQGLVSALVVLSVVIAVQQLEGHVLQPLIMGRAVSPHPLAVILAIATGQRAR